jgi:hypothetical protein
MRKRNPERDREVALIERGEHRSQHRAKHSGKTTTSQTRSLVRFRRFAKPDEIARTLARKATVEKLSLPGSVTGECKSSRRQPEVKSCPNQTIVRRFLMRSILSYSRLATGLPQGWQRSSHCLGCVTSGWVPCLRFPLRNFLRLQYKPISSLRLLWAGCSLASPWRYF